MFTRTRFAAGVIAVSSFALITSCAPATLGVSTGTILSTVIANIPRSAIPDGGNAPTSARIPTPSGARIPRSAAPSAAAARVLQIADSYVGVKYVWGGNSPNEGFDCSGFTKYVFAKRGIVLPRTSHEQVRAGTAVAPDFRALLPGDLMLFAEPGQAISHVAIYAGSGRIIHSSSAVGGVGYTDLNSGGEWFVEYFVAARRVQ